MNWLKKEKTTPPPIPSTAQQKSDQWLADLTQKLQEQGLPIQSETPSADDRNAAAIAQSTRQYFSGHVEKKVDKKKE